MYKISDRILVRSSFNDKLFYDTIILQIKANKYLVNETCMDSAREIWICSSQVVGIFDGTAVLNS